ncbi:MAG: DNA translocase FtsK 4TM domain-containing protein, partial [Desulfobacula sp.]
MKKELIGILFLFLVILTGVSLFSYHASDPCVGNSVFTIPKTIHNSFGLLGAHMAGFFIYLFGLGAFWLPMILALTGIWILKGRSGKIIGLTVLGGCLLMICTGGLLFLVRTDYMALGTRISSGGVVGISIAAFLLKYANIAGCVTILVFFILIGFILTTGISLITLFAFFNQKTGEVIKEIQEGLQELIDFVKEKYNKRVKEKEEQKRQIDITPVRDMDELFIKLPERIQERQEPAEPEPYIEPEIITVEPDDPEFKPIPVFKDIREKIQFKLPLISFLDEKKKVKKNIDTELLKEKAKILESKLNDFNVFGEVVEILPGPVITTFEYKPAPGIKISK